MKLFDILKKKKPAFSKTKIGKKKKKEKRIEKKEKKVKEKPVELPILGKEKQEKKVIKGTGLPRQKKYYEQTYRILKAPHITEKATDLMKNNQYIFKVYKKSNRQEIKKAVEGLYSVDVLSVKIINIHRKRKKMGGTSGWKAGEKKAIVRVKKDQKIEILPR